MRSVWVHSPALGISRVAVLHDKRLIGGRGTALLQDYEHKKNGIISINAIGYGRKRLDVALKAVEGSVRPYIKWIQSKGRRVSRQA